LIWSLNESANLLLRAIGVRLPTETERVHGPNEIMLLVKRGMEVGTVEQDEQAMIHGVFGLTRTVARELMTPRPDIVAVPVDVGFEELVRTINSSGHSRLPVYRDNLDNVVGIVLAKDLLPLSGEVGTDFDVTRIMRDPYFVPDTKSVDDLLAEFRRLKILVAIVVDEFGGTDGVVTLEDLVEEIVGDIFDEHDVAEEEIERLPDGRVRLDGGAALADVVDELELENVEDVEEYDTVAGWVIGRLGRIPTAGETVRMGQAELEVIETQEQRVTRLELRLVPADGGRVSEPILEGERESR
jgi:CBS domain containing-hemolysin-like protein